MNTPRTTFYEDFSIAEFPSPIGVNHYELEFDNQDMYEVLSEFPSPTGVNHYE